jgi:hypothetical protein
MRLLLTMAFAAGCAGTGSYAVTASVDSPELAYVSPGVYAVADYGEPVFYTDNYYWRWHNGLWYRSHRYNSGWVHYNRPPRAVVTIREPQRYRHYRIRGDRYRVDRGRVVRGHRR